MKKLLLLLSGSLFTSILHGADLSGQRQQILDYLTRLSDPAFNGVIIGQHSGSANGIADSKHFPNTSYAHYFDELATKTGGKYIGLVDVNFEYMGPYTDAQILATSNILIEHARKGGLVSVTWTPRNPFDTRPAPKTTGDFGDCDPYHISRVQSSCPAPVPAIAEDLTQLLLSNPVDNPARAKWKQKLDKLIMQLKYLQDAGVVVLFRPLQEHNGNIFWYSKQGAKEKVGANEGRILEYNPEPFVALWRDMHQYFKANGLNNLIWVWSPMESEYFSRFYYPGHAYVDVVAGTAYRGASATDPRLLDLGTLVNAAIDPVKNNAYADWTGYGKPVGFAEYGVSEDSILAKQSDAFDVTNYAKKIKAKYPKAAYFTVWSSWSIGSGKQNYMALIEHSNTASTAANVYNLLNDPYIITADKIPVAVSARTTPPVNLMADHGFEAGSMNAWDKWGTFSLVNNASSAYSGNWYGLVGPASELASKLIPATFGARYSLAVHGKTSGNAAQRSAVGYSFFNSSGLEMLNTKGSLLPFVTNSYAYQTQDNIVAPLGASSIRVVAWNDVGTASMSVDDFSLTGILGTNELGNLVINPGFQSSHKEDSLGLPDGSHWSYWTKWGNGFSVVTDNAHAEGLVCKVNPNSGVAQNIPLIPGKKQYTLSAWGMVTSGQWASLQYQFLGANGNALDSLVTPALEPFSASYSQKTIIIEPPADAVSLLVGAWNVGSGYLYIDDFSLR